MSSVVANAGTYTDFQGLAQLKTKAAQQSPEAVREAARQFESLFLQMMLKSMRDASFGDALFDSDETQMYRDMLDKQVSLDLTKHQSIGLADMLVRQLGGEETPDAAKPAGPDLLSLQRYRRPLSPPQPDNTVNEKQVEHPLQANFVERLWPHAEKAAASLGVDPQVLVAQAALETGWGQSTIKQGNGAESFNLFGIKAGNAWQGDEVAVKTKEFEAGRMIGKTEAFRSYKNLAEGFADYVSFLRDNPRYGQALEKAGNAREFVEELSKAGYATDPKYADKINSIMERNAFQQAVAKVKNG